MFRFKIGSVGGKEQEEWLRKCGGGEWGMDNVYVYIFIIGIIVFVCLRQVGKFVRWYDSLLEVYMYKL